MWWGVRQNHTAFRRRHNFSSYQPVKTKLSMSDVAIMGLMANPTAYCSRPEIAGEATVVASTFRGYKSPNILLNFKEVGTSLVGKLREEQRELKLHLDHQINKQTTRWGLDYQISSYEVTCVLEYLSLLALYVRFKVWGTAMPLNSPNLTCGL